MQMWQGKRKSLSSIEKPNRIILNMTYFRRGTNRVACCAREFLSIFFEYYEGIGVKDARHAAFGGVNIFNTYA
jgi:hypothetical protein